MKAELFQKKETYEVLIAHERLIWKSSCAIFLYFSLEFLEYFDASLDKKKFLHFPIIILRINPKYFKLELT